MPDWEDMRGFLDYLEKRGELIRIKKEVDTIFEVAAYIRKSSDVGGPAFLFERVKDFPDWRAVGALYATHGRVALALGTSPEKALARFQEAIENPIEPVLITSAPCQEVVIEGDEVDLFKLPIVKHSEKDAGRYITSAVQIAKDPETGVKGLGMHRMLVKGKDRLGLWAPGERRIGRAFLKCEERGRPLDIAICNGLDPLVVLGSVARVPHDVEKLSIAGGLRGEPVKLVPCKTIDLEVPAHAEVVIEGEVLPGVREREAPFGEFTGCHSYEREAPVVRVRAITMRREPIWQTVLTGMPVTEDHILNWLAVCQVIYQCASYACPEVRGVNVFGNYVYEAVVSIKKRMEGEPYNVIASVLGGPAQAKYCIVVDEDINVFDWRDVEWALCTRVQPHRDVHIFPVMLGAPLDPSAPIPRHTSKLGIDATIPLDADRARFERCRVPGAEEVSW